MDIIEYMKREEQRASFEDDVQKEVDRLSCAQDGWDQFYEFADESRMRFVEFYLAEIQECNTLDQFLEVKRELKSMFEGVIKPIVKERLE